LSGCLVPRQGRNSQPWRGIAIHEKSSLTDGPGRQERSRRLAGSLPKSEFFDPPCFTLRTESALGSGPNPGRTVTVRVRFANLNSATRSVTLDSPISATVILAEVAEGLARAVLADHPDEKTISLLAISVSHLEEHRDLELELPLGLEDEPRRPGTKNGHGTLVG
jgi:hypothetical protein